MGRGWIASSPSALLATLSIVYLILPLFIFFLGWLKIGWGVIACGTFLAAILTGRKHIVDIAVQKNLFGSLIGAPEDATFGQKRLRSAVTAAGTAGVLLVSVVLLWGVGGYGPQDSDYPKHNAILKILIDSPWPPYVDSDRGVFPLVFYVAYYLPGAVVGKIAGWDAANHLLQLWSILGLILALAWFWILVGRLSWAVPCVFFFFSGWDVIGAFIIRLLQAVGSAGGVSTIFPSSAVDWYALRWWNWQARWWDPELVRSYPSALEQLFFVPNQALAGWITVGLLVFLGTRDPVKALTVAGFLVTTLSLWSPFKVIGLMPILFWLLWETRRRGATWGTMGIAFLSGSNLWTIPALVVIGSYYLARFHPLPFVSAPEANFGIGHHHFTWPEFLFRLSIFLLVEVGVPALLIVYSQPFSSAADWRLFVCCLTWLLVLPFFRYGACNDFVMRAGAPALFLLSIWLARGLSDPRNPPIKRFIVAGCFIIGSTAPLSDFYAHFREALRLGRLVEVPKKDNQLSLWELSVVASEKAEISTHPLVRAFRGQTFFLQYVGSPQGFFFRYLARYQPSFQPTSSKREPFFPLRSNRKLLVTAYVPQNLKPCLLSISSKWQPEVGSP